jgi:hypothetical protein
LNASKEYVKPKISKIVSRNMAAGSTSTTTTTNSTVKENIPIFQTGRFQETGLTFANVVYHVHVYSLKLPLMRTVMQY